ncbi:MAG: DUF1461 domain-containing protein [Anaerolineae bacterium]|jgi:integral membrane protein (TIGR01906 family)|nr:DUF1461 domain-containing protein [Anaerolineae bacterium]
MKHSPRLLWLLHGLLLLAVPVLLVVGSVRLVMTPAWLTFEYTRPGFPVDYYGFSTADRLAYGPYGIHYLLSGADIAYLAALRLPRPLCYEALPGAADCPMFNAGELRHMVDVQRVTVAAFAGGSGLALLAFSAGVVLWRRDRHHLLLALLRGSLLTLGLIVTIVITAAVAWDFFFDAFHALFFEAGTWRFYYSDTLIRLYPEQFWFDSALLVGVLTGGGAAGILALAWHRLHRRHQQP